MVTQDGDHIWQVVVMKEDRDVVAGEYWYEDGIVAAVRTSDLDTQTIEAHDAIIEAASGQMSTEASLQLDDLDRITKLIELADDLDPCGELQDETQALIWVLAEVVS